MADIGADRLRIGDTYAEFGMDKVTIGDLDQHGDRILITTTDGTETSLDIDTVVDLISRKKEN